MAKKTESKELRLNSLELALFQRNVMARELRDVKVSVLDDQIADFDAELARAVKDRLGIDLHSVTLNTRTGEITKTPQKKVG